MKTICKIKDYPDLEKLDLKKSTLTKQTQAKIKKLDLEIQKKSDQVDNLHRIFEASVNKYWDQIKSFLLKNNLVSKEEMKNHIGIHILNGKFYMSFTAEEAFKMHTKNSKP